MNLLFITNTLPPKVDGVGDYTYNIAREFARNGHSVSIVCRRDDSAYTPCEGVKIYPCIERWEKPALCEIERIIKSDKIEIVSLQYVPHGFHPKGLPFGLIGIAKGIKKCGAKLFVFCHEVYLPFEGWNIKKTLYTVLMRYVTGQILKQADYVATSIKYYRGMIQKIVKHLPTIGEIPIMSNVPKSKVSNDQIESLRSKIATRDEIVVSFFGLRDIASSILAIEKLKSSGVKIKVMLIGKTPSKFPFNISMDIYKTGILNIEDIDNYFQVSDILILPQCNRYGCSFKSGSLAAAQSAGLSILTAKGKLTDESMVDRENVVFVDFTQEQSILEGLTFLLSEENRVMIGANAKQLVETNSWEATYKSYMKLIN